MRAILLRECAPVIAGDTRQKRVSKTNKRGRRRTRFGGLQRLQAADGGQNRDGMVLTKPSYRSVAFEAGATLARSLCDENLEGKLSQGARRDDYERSIADYSFDWAKESAIKRMGEPCIEGRRSSLRIVFVGGKAEKLFANTGTFLAGLPQRCVEPAAKSADALLKARPRKRYGIPQRLGLGQNEDKRFAFILSAIWNIGKGNERFAIAQERLRGINRNGLRRGKICIVGKAGRDLRIGSGQAALEIGNGGAYLPASSRSALPAA